MFLFIRLFITVLIVLSKNTPGTCRVFKHRKVLWTLTSDKEIWKSFDENPDEVDYTIYFEALTPSVSYIDEVWCCKVNNKLRWKRIAEACKRQIKENKTDFVDVVA